MKIGWIGLGKVGLPCALALAAHGHQVTGHDVSDKAARILAGDLPQPREEGFAGALGQGRGRLSIAASVADVVAASDVVFCCVQTPHPPGFGGEKPLPPGRRDFEYAHLIQAVRDVSAAAESQRKKTRLIVVSTVLPGTMSRLIAPLAGSCTEVAYSPVLISLGTVIPDFTRPEAVICGSADPDGAGWLRDAVSTIHAAPVLVTDFATAELAKMAWNLLLSARIVFAGWLMEVAHATGADCDVVAEVMDYPAARRIRPGLGDGGPCRPRDAVALSWLSQRHGLSFDLPGELARAREAQAGWIAGLAAHHSELANLPVAILGIAYKPGSDLKDGSPALLLRSLMANPPAMYDHHAFTAPVPVIPGPEPAVFVIGTAHEEYRTARFPSGSVVIDPWGIIPDEPGVTVIRPGRR